MNAQNIESQTQPLPHSSTRPVIVIAALLGMLTCGLAALRPVEALAQAQAQGQAQGNEPGALELVDPNVFRACGDPRNLPFSNDESEGFENKLAELFAAKLGKKLSYTYFPQATGFVRMTIGSYRCDVIMGFPQGDDQAQVTVPYYRTTYALIFKPGSGLEDVTTIDDPRLKDKRIGVVAKTPPSTNMAVNGLLGHAKSYPLFIDTRADSSAQAMIDDLARQGIAYVPYFPLGGFTPLQSSTLSAVANQLGATPMQVALAWLLHRSPNILLIPGTSSVAHLRENLKHLTLPQEA